MDFKLFALRKSIHTAERAAPAPALCYGEHGDNPILVRRDDLMGLLDFRSIASAFALVKILGHGAQTGAGPEPAYKTGAGAQGEGRRGSVACRFKGWTAANAGTGLRVARTCQVDLAERSREQCKLRSQWSMAELKIGHTGSGPLAVA